MKEQKKLALKKEKGITLIVLVITIIILLILAGVTINIAVGQNGLFSKSKEAVEKHKESAAREKINMTLAEYMFDINSKNMPKEEQESHLLELLGNLGPTTDGEDHYETVVDGYVFWVDKETEEITSKGPEKTVKLTGIKVKEESKNITINVGQTKLIEIEVEPEGASTRDIEYTSSDASIAEVKNGTVKGIKVGTATITVSSSKNASIKETINVTVKEVEVESISLEPTTLTVSVGKTTAETIRVTYTPTNAVNKTVTWSTSDENIATVNEDGKVTGVAEGTATITATTPNGKTATCEVDVEEGGVDKHINIDGVSTVVNTKDVYGQTVTGYTCGRSDVTWQLFYIDEEEKDNENDVSRVYLIASDYVTPPENNISEDKKLIEGGSESYPKAYRFGTKDGDTSLLGEFTGTIPDNSFTQKFLSDYAGTSASRTNLQATNYMLDQNIWSEYKGAKANYAFGGPTLPLFAASYNDICKSSTKLGYSSTTDTGAMRLGYYVSIGDGKYTSMQDGYGDTSTQKGMYFKGNDLNSAAGMWLASPEGYRKTSMLAVDYLGGMSRDDYFGYYKYTSFGIRPVVSLNSNVQFTRNENGSFSIKQ